MTNFNLKQWIDDHDMNMDQFSKLACIHRNTVSNIIKGGSKKNIVFIESFCKLFDKDKEFRQKVLNIKLSKKEIK